MRRRKIQDRSLQPQRSYYQRCGRVNLHVQELDCACENSRELEIGAVSKTNLNQNGNPATKVTSGKCARTGVPSPELFTLPVWRALVEEGIHAFAEILVRHCIIHSPLFATAHACLRERAGDQAPCRHCSFAIRLRASLSSKSCPDIAAATKRSNACRIDGLSSTRWPCCPIGHFVAEMKRHDQVERQLPHRLDQQSAADRPREAREPRRRRPRGRPQNAGGRESPRACKRCWRRIGKWWRYRFRGGFAAWLPFQLIAQHEC
jgi:hypothetical protein